MLSLFTGITVFALFVLVSYTVITGSCCSLAYQHSASDELVREINVIEERLVVNEVSNISFSQLRASRKNDKRSATRRNTNFMSLIPNRFSVQNSRHSLLHRKITKSSHSSPSMHPVYNCTDNVCSEHLTTDDHSRYNSCLESVQKLNITLQNSRCKFINGTGRDPVALVSLPGSGNTWIRGILEHMTGICTGAVYCDISLRSHGFTGEYVRESSVLVVKTHENNPVWMDEKKYPKKQSHRGQFGSAVYILRNPFNALVAEWNRKVANNFTRKTTNLKSHTEAVGREWFGDNKLWQTFVQEQARRWKTMLMNWVINNKHHPVLVVKYESIQTDSVTESERILDFLGINSDAFHTQTLNYALQTFHRKHRGSFDHYTASQRSFVLSVLKETAEILEENDLSKTVDIYDYYSSYIGQ